jgi:NAD(P)H dehydrogenase (quinone)
MKEKILVMTANGHVGFPTACELLSLGFQVRAFVRNPNSDNSKRLKELGAELFVGNQDDINDLKQSLKGVQRAFYNSPASSGHFSRTDAFIKLTEEEGLEHVVYLTQWLSSENHHSPHTREHWLADEAVKKHKKVNYTFVNPGLFAFFYFMTKEVVAHFGMFPTPIKNAGLGKIGLNAPPSEEDQGRVVAHILKEPTLHASKTYRPTGPKLISLADVVAIFSKITGKEIKIAEVSKARFLKSLNSMDAPKVDKDYIIMNVPYYQEELGRNSFAVGPSAVTSVVKDLTGKEPEDFETIARREFENSPELKPTFSNKMKAFKGFLKIIFASEPSIQKLESKYGIPTSKGGYKYAQENLNWVKEHESQQSKVST